MDFKACLAYAVRDVKENRHMYREKFLEQFT